MACMMLFTACKEAQTDDASNSETSLKFELYGIMLDGDGGTYDLKYTINNGIEGIDIATDTDVKWITRMEAQNGTLSFDYEPNFENAERSATIMVTYPNVNRVMINIRQSIFGRVTFEMEITEQTTTSCTTKITPSDNETTYIVYMAEVAYLLGAQIGTSEELFRDDYNYFMDFAEQVNAPELKEFFLENYFAYQGEQSIEWEGMMPGSDYVLYVYAVEFNEENNDYTLASPITHKMVVLDGPELSTVDFNVKVEVNGPMATYKIDPQSWEGKYYLNIYEEGDYMYRSADTPVDEKYAKLISDVWIGMMGDLFLAGYSADTIIEYMCLEGYEEYSETLKASTNYAIVVYGIGMVDGVPQVTSMPVVANFSTEEIGPSDMTIEIKVENKYVRVADITITPSKNEPFTAAIITKSNVPEIENKELISWLNNNVRMDNYSGEITSHLNTLKPETEYSILAYGYWGGVVTTDLFRYDFKTDAAGVCENSVIRVDIGGPYSLMELEAYDPNKYYNYGMFESMGSYAMWAEIITEQPTKDLFFNIYKAEELVIGGSEAIFEDLVSYTCKQTELFTPMTDKLYVMCAAAMDYRGNYSEVWMSDPFSYSYNAATKRPIEELFEKLNNTPTSERKEAKKAGVTNHLVK